MYITEGSPYQWNQPLYGPPESDRFCRVGGDAIQLEVIYGGGSKQQQLAGLRKKPRIVAATPGRLIEFLEETLFYFNFLLNELVWEGNCVNTEGVRWKMYETCTMCRYSKRSSVACHLASSAPCRTSSAWCVNSMAVFASKKYPLWNTWSMVSGDFIWFHQTSLSKLDIQIVSKPLKEEDTLFASHWHLACVHARHPWNDRSLSQTKQVQCTSTCWILIL